ncbi:MAG: hypothetical protein HKN76_19090 [Saprospiraceae bacterium]|nr:hypothetical protein [Saprospiraceae bacterium]
MLVLLFVLYSEACLAQFTLSAEVRPRTEFRDGFKTPTTSSNQPAFFTEQRSRLYFDVSDAKFRFRLALQDVSIWGENAQIFKEQDGNTYLSEAWGQYFVTPNLSFKLGRQILSYDNQRFLGGLEWAQQGRRHDALLMLFEDGEHKTKLHIGGAFNSDDDQAEPAYLQGPSASFYSVPGNYKNMQFAWFNKLFSAGNISLLALNTTYQDLSDSTSFAKQTYGAIGKFGGKKLSIGTDFYYQRGKVRKSELSAFLAGINATITTKLTPLTFGIEYISGTDAGENASGKLTNFSPDFGTNHAHNGFMDYFFVGPANGSVGVTDIYFKSKIQIGKGSIVANFHEFLTGSRQFDLNQNELAKPMGFEVDLVYAINLSPVVGLHVGYSHLIASETMLALRPGDAKHNNWAWLMVTFKPVLFESEDQKAL